MNKPAHPKSRQTGSVSVLLLLVLCFLVYAAAVAGYAVWSYREHKKTLMAEIDHDLLQAARSLKYLLANDFHDRALDKDSIGKDEELRNRRLVTDFGVESGFKWVYTLAEKDGKFFFSAPSVSEEEAKELDSWYFYPYEDVPEEFVAAFRENRTVYVEYTDQWGTFRSVAVPERSPGGRLYLACADREIGDIDALLRRNLLQSAAVAAFFLLASLPFILLLDPCLPRAHGRPEAAQRRTARPQGQPRNPGPAAHRRTPPGNRTPAGSAGQRPHAQRPDPHLRALQEDPRRQGLLESTGNLHPEELRRPVFPRPVPGLRPGALPRIRQRRRGGPASGRAPALRLTPGTGRDTMPA